MAFLRGSLRATSFFGGSPPLPIFLRLLGSSSSSSPSRPRFLPPESPAPLVLGPPPSCAPLPSLVPAPPPAVGFFRGLPPPEPPAPPAVFLATLDSVCQLNAFLFRGVFVPVDFGQWDLLSVLFLEVGDELPHLVGAPTSFGKGLLQGSSKPVINKERREGLSRGHMSRAGRQSQMYLLLHTFWCCSSLRQLGFFIRRILHHHLPVRASPWSRVLLWILLSSSHGWRLSSGIFSCSLLRTRHKTRRPPPHVCTVKGLCFGKARSSFILRQPIT